MDVVRQDAPRPDVADLEGFRTWFNELATIRWIGVECVDLEPGRVRSVLAVRDEQRNPGGAVNGGVLLAAADVTAGVAVTSTAAVGAAVATTDLTMHFMAPAVESPLELRVEVLRRGGRAVVPHVRITDATGRLCAVATGTWAVRDPA